MNKNIVKLFAIVMMIFMIGAVLVACGAQGEQGEQGIQGNPGVPGEQGPQGPAGHSPYPGENGNWWYWNDELGEYVDSGLQVKGENATDCENHQWDKHELVTSEHKYNAVTGEATIGVVLRTCVDCGDAYWFEIGHELVKGETVAPTCQADGYTVYNCACGYSENKDAVAKIDHILGDKEYTKNEAGICECEWTNPYVQHCTMCDIVLVTDADGAKDHVWGEYNPMKNENNANPCTWVGGTIAQCVNCNCEGHVDINPDSEAKGHEWSQWTLDTNAADYTLVRTCADCSANFAEGTETKVITLADCGEPAVTAPTCTVAGKKVYSYTIDGQTIEIYTESIDATGHTVKEDSAYTVAADYTSITTTCATEGCGATLTMALPELTFKGAYMIQNGDCDEPQDIYSILLTDKNEEINGAIFVTFSVDANYGHNNGLLGEGATEIVIEINGTKYDAYWCSTCQHWIAYQEHVD